MKRITHWKFQKNTEVQNQALKTMELTKQNISIVNDVASIWVPPLIKSSFNLSICPSSFTFTSSSRTCSKSFSFLSSFCFIIPSNFLVTSIRCSMYSFLAELSIRRSNSNILLSCLHCFFLRKEILTLLVRLWISIPLFRYVSTFKKLFHQWHCFLDVEHTDSNSPNSNKFYVIGLLQNSRCEFFQDWLRNVML